MPGIRPATSARLWRYMEPQKARLEHFLKNYTLRTDILHKSYDFLPVAIDSKKKVAYYSVCYYTSKYFCRVTAFGGGDDCGEGTNKAKCVVNIMRRPTTFNIPVPVKQSEASHGKEL